MKNRFTKLTAVLALLAFLAVPLGMRGQTRTEVTWTASEQGYSNGASLDGVSIELDDYITIQFDKNDGNNPPAYYNTGTAARLYSKNSLTVTPASGYQITGMTLTFSGTGYTGTLGASVGSYSLNSITGTWSGSSLEAVVLTNNAGSGHARLQELTVTYTDGSTPPPTTYTVTYNANVTGVAPVVDTYNEGANVTLRPANTFTNEGYTFSEWNTQADGDGDPYDAGDVIENIQENIELYAIWTENPVSNEQWVLANLADLTESDVFVIVGNNGSNYAMTNDNGTGSAPATAAVTIESDVITSTVAANIQWTVSGNATDGYTFYPNGSTTTWLYCNTTNPSGSNNNMRVGTGDRKVFELNSNDYLMTKDDYAVRYLSIYNNADWRGYINTNLCPALSFYKKVTGGVLPPSISAENVSIEYNATSGSITYTINNEPDPAGTLTAAVQLGGTIANLTIGTIANNTVSFTCATNDEVAAHTATVTLTYTYGDNQTVSKEVTITQAGNPNNVNNISDITEVGADYHVKGMVVAVSNKGFIICDGTGLVYTYLNAVPTQQLGEYVQITGTTGSYGHVIQFTSSATIAETEDFNFDWPDYTVITEVPNYTEGYHLSDYFQFEGTLTKSGNYYLVAVGEGQIRISYPTDEQAADLETLLNKTVRIHGFFTGYSGTGSNAVFTAMMESYEEVTAPAVPTITVTPATAQAFTYVVGNGPSTEQLFEPTGANLTSIITVTVTQNGAFEIISGSYSEYGYTVTSTGDNDGVFVRLKAGLEEGSYTDTLTFSSEGAENVVIALTGTVTAPEAPHYTWDLSIASYDEIIDPDIVTWSSDYATMTNSSKSGGTSASNYLGGDANNRTSSRFYNGNTLTLAPASGYAITSVVFTATGANYATTLANSTWTNATATVDGVTVTVTPTDGNLDMSATIGGTCGFTAVTVYYETSTAVYYDIELLEVENGTIATDKTRAQEGQTVTLTATPATNYYVSDWTILDGDAEEVEWTDQGTDKTEVTFTMPASDVTVEAVFATDLVYYDIIIDNEIEHGTITANATQALEGTTITLTVTPDAGYILDEESLIVLGDPDEVEVTKMNVTTYTFEMPASDVLVSAEFTEVQTTTYTLATSIESGRHYIIVAMDGDEAYAMGGQNNNNRAAVSITVVDGVAQVSSDEVCEFVINTVGFTDEIDPYNVGQQPGWGMAVYPGYWKYTIYDAAKPGYLYAASSTNNYLRTETHLDANDNGVWAVEIYDENETQYAAHIAAFGNNTRKMMRFNSSNHIFSCYDTDNSMKEICLYVKEEDVPQYDFYKDVKGYGTSEGGYTLMATPTIENANPNLVGMITDDGTDPDNFKYDLYSFDFTQELEWLNYRAGAFNLLNGQGYLYANKNNVTLHFQGASYTSFKSVNLQFGNTNYNWNGWNLIGNPRSDVSWVGTNNFYVMNEAGTEVELSNRSYVNPMEGIFVKATVANQSIYFADWQYYEWDEMLNIKVSGNNSNGDLARVRFGEGQGLEKFQLNPNHTKLYFSQSNKDYAVVSSANEGEMPVNFKAENNGSYTISVNAENVDMNYLHLIDNMTGADVDLLVEPSYSFEAKTTDYASRFKLVFSANNTNENNNESFAYFNGSEWSISNIGEATLQVIDVTGRIIISETVNGNATLTTDNLSAGVYVMRLMNGNDVKTQKVVIR